MKALLILSICGLLATGSHGFLQNFSSGHDIGQLAKPIEQDLPSLENTRQQLHFQTVQDLLRHLGSRRSDFAILNKTGSHAYIVETFISEKVGQLNTALDKLSAFQKRTQSLELLGQLLNKPVTEEEQTVASHSAIADSFLGKIVTEAKGLNAPFLGRNKPNILDSPDLIDIGQSLASFVKPHIDSLKALGSNAGTNLKQNATNSLNPNKGIVNKLGTKLQTHVDALKTDVGTTTSTAREALSTLNDADGQVRRLQG